MADALPPPLVRHHRRIPPETFSSRLISIGYRAYVAMALLHNFLGDRVKSHERLELANSIVDDLPPEIIPRVR